MNSSRAGGRSCYHAASLEQGLSGVVPGHPQRSALCAAARPPSLHDAQAVTRRGLDLVSLVAVFDLETTGAPQSTVGICMRCQTPLQTPSRQPSNVRAVQGAASLWLTMQPVRLIDLSDHSTLGRLSIQHVQPSE